MVDPETIEYTSCGACGGSGTGDDGRPCTNCAGGGWVALFATPGCSEQGRFSGYPTELPLRVRNHVERDLDGRCFVIAEGGLGCELPEPIPVGSLVQLWLAFPTRVQIVHAWSAVCYQQGLRHELEFVSLTDTERLSIVEFCKELAALRLDYDS